MKFAIYNHKGGVGKTTLATHVAFWAMLMGYWLTFLDADRQANSMNWLCGHQWDGEDCFQIDSVTITCNLYRAEDAETLVIDAPPDFDFIENLTTIDPDVWVIPIGGRFSVEGAIRVVETIGARHEGRMVLVANMTNPTTKIGRYEIDEAIKLGIEIFPLAIPRADVVRKAEMLGCPVWDVPYGTRSPATHALRHFAHWLLEGADEEFVYGEFGATNEEILRRYEI